MLTNGCNLNPYHEVRDAAKVAELSASMEAHGWIGAPIVTDGDFQALTGVHRLAALKDLYDRAERFEAEDRIEEFPTIDIRDIWIEAGMTEDIDDILKYETVDEYLEIVNALPVAIRQEYGLDLH